MANLDLVIAPCTTVLELAGALGRPAFLLSNSSELHWRKRPGTLTDVWHRSVEHVESLVLGDKASLVANLVRRITDFSQQQLNSNQKQAS
jgi:capsular polysaccharide export protein